jgi:hypothetical protein
MILLAFTPMVHWLFGLALPFYGNYGLAFRPPQIVYLTILLLILAIFITNLSLKRAHGPQPAAYGHLQTLVDLIDEWPASKQKVFWGHKSIDEHNHICHAGTNSKKLPPVMFNHLYS